MGDNELLSLEAELQGLSNAELASLIIELSGLNGVALALGQEAYRRLTQVRRWDMTNPAVLTVQAAAD